MAETSAARSEGGADGVGAHGSSTRATTIGLVSIGALAALVHGWLAQRQKIPLVLPDEFLYENYARSLANGRGLTWRGSDEGLRSLLYVFAIAPSWLVASGPAAYVLAKGLGTLMMCCVAIPVWLLARRLLDAPLALAVTVLALAGSWMTSTGLLLTENLALPLATASLAAMVTTLRRPGSRWAWAALGLAAATAFTRTQLVVLAPIFLLALAIDVLRQPPGARRPRWVSHRPALVAVAGVCVLGCATLLATDSSVLGLYRGVTDYRPSAGKVFASTAQYGIGLIAMLAVVPAAATLALAARRRNWRDDAVAPLMAVVLAASAVVLLQAGVFGAGFGLDWAIERYVAYVAPLALILMMLAPGRISARVGIAIALLLALSLLAADPIQNPFEQRSTYALTHEIHSLVPGIGHGLGLALFAAAVGVVGIWLLADGGRRLGRRQRTATLLSAGLVLVALGLETGGVWEYQISSTSRLRATMPAHLDWVDRASSEPVAMVMFGYENPRNYVTEFFNERIANLYQANVQLPVRGGACPLRIESSGQLTVSGGCATPRRTLLLVDPFERALFYDETQLAEDPGTARLVRTNGPPRVLSAVSEPCVPRTLITAKAATLDRPPARSVPCEGTLRIFLWLDEPGTVVARFRGGDVQHYGRIGERVVSFPPGVSSAVRIPAAAGAQNLALTLDWSSSAGAPALEGAELRQGATTTSLL